MPRNTAISAHTGYLVTEADKTFYAWAARQDRGRVIHNRRASMYLEISDHGRPPQAYWPARFREQSTQFADSVKPLT